MLFERIEFSISGEVAKDLHETRAQNRLTSKLNRGDLPTMVYYHGEGIPLTTISIPNKDQVVRDKNVGDSKASRMKAVNGGRK